MRDNQIWQFNAEKNPNDYWSKMNARRDKNIYRHVPFSLIQSDRMQQTKRWRHTKQWCIDMYVQYIIDFILLDLENIF